ncbi:MAG TPA: prephenate dehydrogenase/arogenate dehydrogenase family protein [Chloroflexi bacterium]|mgnify:CR=1 FL=1|nr:prephenate dehydrogenase/arogenate dehydrogenase family protein [Chloroflexota bacterium]
MDFKRVAIIGVDPISVSIALALKERPDPPEIVGFHTESVAADLARARGAFDRTERKPGPACQNADLVIVAQPLAAIRDTFAAIAPQLQFGCFVTDTARLKSPVMQWAAELLPSEVHFVGGHIVLSPAAIGIEPQAGPAEASPDLLRGALYCLTTSATTVATALDTFAALAHTLGAQPFFLDAIEHDGLQVGVEELPDLLAVALLRATVDTPGWQEMRKFAGHRFAVATQNAAAAERIQAICLNRANVLHRLNTLLIELTHLRDLLSQEEAGPFEEALATTAEGRQRWLAERERGLWDSTRRSSMDLVPPPGEQIKQIFFGKILDRRKD